MKNSVDHAAGVVGRVSGPQYIGANPDPVPATTADKFIAWNLFKGIGWIMLCVTWFPLRDAIAEWRWAKGADVTRRL